MATRTIEIAMVRWLRSTADAANEGGCHIGDRHYEGRAGELVEVRADDAAILAAGGFVSYVVELG
jgi:hypothetical protein